MEIQEPLSLASKLSQSTVLERVREVFGEKPINGPWIIEMDPTTACNLACHDCISANLLNQGGIDSERIMRLAEEFKEIGVKGVVLIGGGEPMAHKNFGDLVDSFHANGIHVGVTTNGTLIGRYMDQIANKTKWLRVSMDAGTEKTFGEFRPGPSGKNFFNSIIDQMKELAKVKTGKLGYSFLLLSKYSEDGTLENTNSRDIYEAACLAKEIGCDYFEVKPSFDMMHFLNHQTHEVVEIANEQLKRIQGLATDTFSVIAPFTLDEALHGHSTQIKDYKRCYVSELRTVVTPSGVYVCPYHRGNLNMRIGDATKTNFRELWFGQKRATVMNRVNPSIHCTFHCIRHQSNLLLEKYINGEVQIDGKQDFDWFI